LVVGHDNSRRSALLFNRSPIPPLSASSRVRMNETKSVKDDAAQREIVIRTWSQRRTVAEKTKRRRARVNVARGKDSCAIRKH
jgi:hypothetical protein